MKREFKGKESTRQGDVTDELSPQQIKRLERALESAKNGKTITDKVARERIKKFFNR